MCSPGNIFYIKYVEVSFYNRLPLPAFLAAANNNKCNGFKKKQKAKWKKAKSYRHAGTGIACCFSTGLSPRHAFHACQQAPTPHTPVCAHLATNV
jgi:hypothetical protein